MFAGNRSAERQKLRWRTKLGIYAGLISPGVDPIPAMPLQKYGVEAVEREARVGIGKSEALVTKRGGDAGGAE